jgi:hypothetical protein
MTVGQKCSVCDKPAEYMSPDFFCATHYKRQWQKYNRSYINGKKGILLHRHIMEQFIGRKLDNDEVVHHKNGDQGDNRIENLELMEKVDHLKMHAELRKKII